MKDDSKKVTFIIACRYADEAIIGSALSKQLMVDTGDWAFGDFVRGLRGG